jgi:hypothetical protein
MNHQNTSNFVLTVILCISDDEITYKSSAKIVEVN